MNKVFLSGYVVREPEISKSARSGILVMRTRIAVHTQGGRGNQLTHYIDLIAFGSTAMSVENRFHNGDFIAIEGQLNSNRYVNRNGQTIYSTSVVVESMFFSSDSLHNKEATDPVGGVRGHALSEEDAIVDDESLESDSDDSTEKTFSPPLSEKSDTKPDEIDPDEETFKTSTYRVDHPDESSTDTDEHKIYWSKDIG